MFFLSVTVILAGVVAILTYPFWIGSKTGENPETSQINARDQDLIDLEIEREIILNSLAELEGDLIQGRLAPKDYERLRTIDERRLLQILDRIDLSKKGELPQKDRPRRTPRSLQKTRSSVALSWIQPLLLVCLVVGGASGIYRFIQWEQEREAIAQGGGQGMPDPRVMLARLEARLKENPNDLQGQMMAGRSYMTLGRVDEARKAWSKVLDLDQQNYEAHFNLGVLLLQTPTEDSKVFEEALRHFDTALIQVPDEPVILWYKGISLVHLKRYSEAE
ncbi:MAG TPA: tetratricopeptide repeat protein, partial [Nitrospiria bacterium]|nr:tetratricopeptide repeat protein [Nitrospiria bacterium]